MADDFRTGRSPARTAMACSGIRIADRNSMPLYHFKLIDSRIVSDHGVHDLPNETAAQIEAIKLARSLRASRPELVGKNCVISVTDEGGTGICAIPLDIA
jgi:uncharacterized protein DUF6894